MINVINSDWELKPFHPSFNPKTMLRVGAVIILTGRDSEVQRCKVTELSFGSVLWASES